jgi:hypothetical protein
VAEAKTASTSPTEKQFGTVRRRQHLILLGMKVRSIRYAHAGTSSSDLVGDEGFRKPAKRPSGDSDQ